MRTAQPNALQPMPSKRYAQQLHISTPARLESIHTGVSMQIMLFPCTHGCCGVSRGSSVAPCAPVARKRSARARCYQLCRGRAAPAAVGAVTKECVVPQRSKLSARDLDSALQQTVGQCWLRKRTASHAMSRQRASLRGRLNPFLGKLSGPRANVYLLVQHERTRFDF